MKNVFKGAGPALITPFKKDLSVDFDALEKVLELQLKEGANFLVALGTTAESVTMTHNERHKVYRFIREKNNGQLPLMVGFGGNNTAEVINHIKAADFEGIDAILSVVPYYNKPNQEGIYRHFMAIAQVCPVPIVLYNIPSRCGVNMTAETTIRLAQASDKFIGIKEASGDMFQMKTIIENTADNFVLLSGDDAVIQNVMEIGGDGVISVMANALPGKTVRLSQLSATDQEAAKALQKKYESFLELLFIEGNPAGIKAALHQMGLIENELRLPLCPASTETYNKIKQAISKLQ